MSAPTSSTGNAADDTSGAAADRSQVGGSTAPAPGAAPPAARSPADSRPPADVTSPAATPVSVTPATPAAEISAARSPVASPLAVGSSLAEPVGAGTAQPVPAPRVETDADDIHQEVGAFALGVLDDEQSIQFAAHLAECTRCANELDTMLATREALAQIDAQHLATTEQVLRDGHLLARLIEHAPELASEPSRLPHPRTALRSSVIALAVLLIGVLVAAIVLLV